MLHEPHRAFEELIADGVGPHRAAQLAAIDYARSLDAAPRILELSERRKRAERGRG